MEKSICIINNVSAFENKLLKQIPGFFEDLPSEFSKEKPNTTFEIIQNFCYCKYNKWIKKNKNLSKNKIKKLVNVVFVKSQTLSNNQEKENCKKIIRNLESSKNHLSYLDKMIELLKVKNK